MGMYGAGANAAVVANADPSTRSANCFQVFILLDVKETLSRPRLTLSVLTFRREPQRIVLNTVATVV